MIQHPDEDELIEAANKNAKRIKARADVMF
jgi:hypothetical protein